VAQAAQTIPAREGVGEYQDRGSRFMTWAFHAPTEDVFQHRLAELRIEHAKARHHCWAWVIGSAYRFHDDGEPGGTAGRPMLQVLEGSGLQDLAAICVRYFGGVKLGTGGLARAYTAAAQRALENAGVLQIEARSNFAFYLPFELLGLRNEIQSVFQEVIFSGEFDAQGWQGKLEISDQQLPRLQAFLAEKGQGRVTLQPLLD
jgi:uncharacterized YigZ family protein